MHLLFLVCFALPMNWYLFRPMNGEAVLHFPNFLFVFRFLFSRSFLQKNAHDWCGWNQTLHSKLAHENPAAYIFFSRLYLEMDVRPAWGIRGCVGIPYLAILFAQHVVY